MVGVLQDDRTAADDASVLREGGERVRVRVERERESSNGARIGSCVLASMMPSPARARCDALPAPAVCFKHVQASEMVTVVETSTVLNISDNTYIVECYCIQSFDTFITTFPTCF